MAHHLLTSNTGSDDMVADGFDEFVCIVDEGSISAAARVLGLPRATLSRHLTRLEDRLGVRLLHHNTRRLAPTRAGEELYRRARGILTAAAEAEQAVRRLDGVPRGLLRISAPPLAGTDRLADVFLGFLARYPEVEIEVFTTMQHVDLVADGIDVALRGGIVRDPALVARRLRASHTRAYAAPAYLEARGTPRATADLAHHDCSCAYDPITLRPVRTWPLLKGGHVQVRGRLATNDIGLRLASALRGETIGLFPEGLQAWQGAPEGTLVPVLPDRVGINGALSIVYPEREHLDPKVRAFVDHMVASADTLMPPSGR